MKHLLLLTTAINFVFKSVIGLLMQLKNKITIFFNGIAKLYLTLSFDRWRIFSICFSKNNLSGYLSSLGFFKNFPFPKKFNCYRAELLVMLLFNFHQLKKPLWREWMFPKEGVIKNTWVRDTWKCSNARGTK